MCRKQLYNYHQTRTSMLFFFFSFQATGHGQASHTTSLTYHIVNKLISRNHQSSSVAQFNVPLNYCHVDFSIKLTRIPDFFLYTVGLPALIISLLALGTFWLPASCGEKITYAISLLLGLTVFLLLVENHSPESDVRPLMMSFISMNFIFIALTLFLTVITVTVHSSRKRINNLRLRQLWLKTIPSILCISPGDYLRKTDTCVSSAEATLEVATGVEEENKAKNLSLEVGGTDQKERENQGTNDLCAARQVLTFLLLIL